MNIINKKGNLHSEFKVKFLLCSHNDDFDYCKR